MPKLRSALFLVLAIICVTDSVMASEPRDGKVTAIDCNVEDDSESAASAPELREAARPAPFSNFRSFIRAYRAEELGLCSKQE